MSFKQFEMLRTWIRAQLKEAIKGFVIAQNALNTSDRHRLRDTGSRL